MTLYGLTPIDPYYCFHWRAYQTCTGSGFVLADSKLTPQGHAPPAFYVNRRQHDQPDHEINSGK